MSLSHDQIRAVLDSEPEYMRELYANAETLFDAYRYAALNEKVKPVYIETYIDDMRKQIACKLITMQDNPPREVEKAQEIPFENTSELKQLLEYPKAWPGEIVQFLDTVSVELRDGSSVASRFGVFEKVINRFQYSLHTRSALCGLYDEKERRKLEDAEGKVVSTIVDLRGARIIGKLGYPEYTRRVLEYLESRYDNSDERRFM